MTFCNPICSPIYATNSIKRNKQSLLDNQSCQILFLSAFSYCLGEEIQSMYLMAIYAAFVLSSRTCGIIFNRMSCYFERKHWLRFYFFKIYIIPNIITFYHGCVLFNNIFLMVISLCQVYPHGVCGKLSMLQRKRNVVAIYFHSMIYLHQNVYC